MSGLGHHECRFGHVLPMSALPADALADTHHRLRQGIKLGSGQSGRQYPFLRYDRAAKTTLGHPRRFRPHVDHFRFAPTADIWTSAGLVAKGQKQAHAMRRIGDGEQVWRTGPTK